MPGIVQALKTVPTVTRKQAKNLLHARHPSGLGSDMGKSPLCAGHLSGLGSDMGKSLLCAGHPSGLGLNMDKNLLYAGQPSGLVQIQTEPSVCQTSYKMVQVWVRAY